ncbi:MAG TPA: sigma-70 family RNA polymerase sigma factor [Trebonia sp.]|jgi:RNA polymerase sigma factor (sigma-70 family)
MPATLTDPVAVSVADVVRHAASGDSAAWDRLMDQYGRLIWSITRDFKLTESDASDVVQTTWMRLVEHINRLEHPERVGAWLATTARNECLRSIASRRRLVLVGEEYGLEVIGDHEEPADEAVLAAERARTVRDAVKLLPHRWQRLMELLMAEQPYAVIADRLDLPVGSIGPTRGRCLDRLRVLLDAS